MCEKQNWLQGTKNFQLSLLSVVRKKVLTSKLRNLKIQVRRPKSKLKFEHEIIMFFHKIVSYFLSNQQTWLNLAFMGPTIIPPSPPFICGPAQSSRPGPGARRWCQFHSHWVQVCVCMHRCVLVLVALHMQRQVIRAGEAAAAGDTLEWFGSSVFPVMSGELVWPGKAPVAVLPRAAVRFLTCNTDEHRKDVLATR